MSKMYVPIGLYNDSGLQETIEVLHKMKADRAFIAMPRLSFDREGRKAEINRITVLKEKLSESGIGSAVWLNTLGFGGKLEGKNTVTAKNFTRKKSIGGKILDDCFCPMDKSFTNAICEIISDIAETGIDMIVLDDELCLSAVPGVGCVCDLHMSEYRKRLGESISIEEIKEKVFTGGKSRYRDVWLDLMGDTMRDFCKTLRKALDKVNPKCRMGFCAGVSSWDFEGADGLELTKLLAGNTKPFLRLTGAPYWRAVRRFGAQSLQNIAESCRLQIKWAENSGVEVFTELDSYPRDRFQCSASFLECIDLATKTSDGADCLKYVFDYTAKVGYETGYVKAHLRNVPLYEEIEKVFYDKKTAGVRIYEEQRKFENYELPMEYIGDEPLMSRWFLQSSIIPTSLGIPTTYEGEGYFGMAFGENAKYLPGSAFRKGLVIDLKAAKILQERGIDVGLLSEKKAEAHLSECFPDYETEISAYCQTALYEIEISEKAEVLSRYKGEGVDSPASYLYENSSGQRFLVYAFVSDDCLERSNCFLSYCRGKQLTDNAEWLEGERLPFVCGDEPMLYCILKEDDNSFAAAYINCKEDEVFDMKINLSFTPRNVRFINCNGKAEDKIITVDYVKPFGYAAVETAK